MALDDIKVFFSCSFREDDVEINDLVRAICNGLHIKCVNVAKGYSATPPEKAREYINESSALIAVITHRDKVGETEYLMPASVREEIAMAYYAQKPLLLIAEQGVRMEGFMQNFATHLSLNRESFKNVGFLKDLTDSLYTLRTEVAQEKNRLIHPEFDEFYSEHSRSLTELHYVAGDEFYWTQSITKFLRFTKPCRRPIKTACWASQTVIVPENTTPIEMEVIIEQGSKNFQLDREIQKETAATVEAVLHIRPEPTENDFLVYTTRFKSKYLNPLYEEDITNPISLSVHDRKFHCFDGLVAIQPTKQLKAQYRFPREYGLTKDDFCFFVGSYTTSVDYIMDSEIKRAKVSAESYGGDLVLDIEVESPFLRHMYGFAWNPPNKSSLVCKTNVGSIATA